jgi:cytosine/adenosine deaminase-related metal-dependent hydrolase
MQRIGRRAFLTRLFGAGAFGGVVLGSSEVAYLLRQATWQRAPRTRLVLLGTIVTFQPEAPVIEHGALYLDEQGRIVAVQAARSPAPPGYSTVPRVETGGMIYPGLIDLHNHPYYDLHGLWTPERTTPYTSRSQWRAEATFEEDIQSPDSPTGVSWQYAQEAALKYVEMKALVGGVTTLQGLGLTSAPREGWLVRHVEAEQQRGVPVAADFVFLPEVPDPYALFRQTMARGTTVLYHLAEGSDPALRSDFEALDQQGCLGPRFIGIHATALSPEQFQRWGARGGTLVWSPLSNLWLYGQTTDVAAAREAGLRICLGPDWSVSGSKNLLGELKVADLWNQHQLKGLFSDQELCQMVTAHAADALGLEDRIGRIRPGLCADLVVLAARRADPYRNLIESTEAHVLLVVANGRACYGMSELVRAAHALNVEAVRVGGADRAISLPDPTVPSAILSWSDVVTTLERLRALQHLRAWIPLLPHGAFTSLDTLAPDEQYFQTLAAASIPGSALNGVREYYAPVSSG